MSSHQRRLLQLGLRAPHIPLPHPMSIMGRGRTATEPHACGWTHPGHSWKGSLLLSKAQTFSGLPGPPRRIPLPRLGGLGEEGRFLGGCLEPRGPFYGTWPAVRESHLLAQSDRAGEAFLTLPGNPTGWKRPPGWDGTASPSPAGSLSRANGTRAFPKVFKVSGNPN